MRSCSSVSLDRSMRSSCTGPPLTASAFTNISPSDSRHTHFAQRDNRASVVALGFRPGKQFPGLTLHTSHFVKQGFTEVGWVEDWLCYARTPFAGFQPDVTLSF